MKMTFRHYGNKDSIPLKYIRQIPNISGVVTALYDCKVGEVWPLDKLQEMKKEYEKYGLEMEVIESVPVHEDIKLGKDTRDLYIKNYAETIRNLGKVGVKCICYNFMPVFDWVRTNLYYVNEDGSTSLAFDNEEILKMDKLELHLPGWDESYSKEELQGLLEEYKNLTHEKLFDNLIYFLEGIEDALNETGINMAIHPDDPPWDIFDLPRIIKDEDSYDKLFSAFPNKHNGLTLCTGSLGASKNNNLLNIIYKYHDRIFFAHLRQIKYNGEHSFIENGHMTTDGDIDIYEVVRLLVNFGFDGYVRSDHGRNIWGENGKPGYGLYDRALGACYLSGLFEAIEKDK